MVAKLISRAPTRLPGDLMPKLVKYKQEEAYYPGGPLSDADVMRRILENTDILVSTKVVERGLLGRAISVTTTPVLVADAQFIRGYIFLNPTASTAGLTSAGTILASATRAALATGNSQATAVGVANFRTMALFLDITGGTGGTVQIDAQTQDPITLNWANSQDDLFGLPTAVGNYYANIGTLGIDSSFAGAFTIGAGGTSEFSLNFVVKDGLVGSASGLPNTIYLGGPDVTTTTGYPLLEGKERELYFRPNAQLWAVSQIAAGVTLNVFDLQ